MVDPPTPVGQPVDKVPAPFPAGTLKPPLTGPQRSAIYSYIAKRTGYQVADVVTFFQDGDPSDAGMISTYEIVLGGGGIVIHGKTSTEFKGTDLIPGYSDLKGFFEAISNPNTWVRVGEFTVGFLLIGLGLHAILTASSSDYASAANKGKAALSLANPLSLPNVKARKLEGVKNADSARRTGEASAKFAQRASERADVHAYRESSRENTHQRSMEKKSAPRSKSVLSDNDPFSAPPVL